MGKIWTMRNIRFPSGKQQEHFNINWWLSRQPDKLILDSLWKSLKKKGSGSVIILNKEAKANMGDKILLEINEIKVKQALLFSLVLDDVDIVYILFLNIHLKCDIELDNFFFPSSWFWVNYYLSGLGCKYDSTYRGIN